ncbi:MAG: hypothetical protein KC423_06280 [Anaerolineales bacterium]|nr:hypothetical protein [Anaerolineales bacterium]
MLLDYILNSLILAYGIYTLFGIAFKPDFYWNSPRLTRARNLVGDKTTVWMYAFVGVVMIGVALWAFFIRG